MTSSQTLGKNTGLGAYRQGQLKFLKVPPQPERRGEATPGRDPCKSMPSGCFGVSQPQLASSHAAIARALGRMAVLPGWVGLECAHGPHPSPLGE